MQEEDHIQIERQAESASGWLDIISWGLWTLLSLAVLIALRPAIGYGNPDSAEAHFQRGAKFIQLNQLDKAESEFLECLKMAPDCAKVYNNLGRIYFRENRLREAVSAFTKAYRLQPRDVEISFNLGLAQYQAGRCAAAIAPLKRAIASKQHSADAHLLL